MQSESETIQELKKGNREAMGAIFDEYGPALYGLALRISESESQAENIVEEAFRRLWKSAPGMHAEETDLFDFLAGHVKKLATETLSPVDSFDFSSFQQQKTKEVNYRIIFKEVDQKHLNIIDLSYLKGLSESQIEEEMNIPAGTVNTRLRNAVKEIRRVLKDRFTEV